MAPKQIREQQDKAVLSCPFCSAGIELPMGQLFDGTAVSCPHCGEEATLIRERIEHRKHDQWSLVLPEPEEDRR